MSDNLEKYYTIMQKYRNHELGDTHLTMQEILDIMGESNLFAEMSIQELHCLCQNTTGLTRQMFLELQKRKITSQTRKLVKKKNI